MLQWMGGSRRKVTTSRKSTYKRQKQYFEQRKRRQQQQTEGSENIGDGVSTCGQHKNQHRSLDILNFLNLSTVSQECSSACPSGKEDLEVNVSTVKYDITEEPSKAITCTVIPSDCVKLKEAGSPLHCQVDAASPKKFLRSSNDDNSHIFSGTGAKIDHRKTATEQQLSVLDLLGDDDANGKKEASPTQEAHVAFSVEGLGKVGMQTPVHSPQQPDRYNSLGCSSPLKAARDLNFLNHSHVLDDLELEVDALMQDINMPRIGSSLEFSSRKMNSYRESKQKLDAGRGYSKHYDHGNKTNSLFWDRRTFDDRENIREDIWDDRSCFLDNDYLDEMEYSVSWKNFPSEIDGKFRDYWKYGNSEMSDYSFDGHHLLRNRDAAQATDIFDISESPASFYKNQSTEIDLDFNISNGTRYPKLGTKFDPRDVTGQSDWFCFATDDARDTISMLSEESCSSSAVRGKATSNSKLNSAAMQSRRRTNAFPSPPKKYGLEDNFAKELWHKSRNKIREGNDVAGSGKFTNMSNSSKSRPFHPSISPPGEKLGPRDSWFYEKGHTTSEMNSGFSLSPDPEKKSLFSGSKFWTEDPSSELLVHGLDIEAKSSFDRSKHGERLVSSTSGSFITEKLEVYDSPVFSKFGTPTMPDFSTDSKFKCTPPDSPPLTGSHGETPFPDIFEEGSASKDVENKAENQQPESEKLELMEETCIGNGLFSENQKAIDASNSRSNTGVCKEAKGVASEMMLPNLKVTRSPDAAEQEASTSSCMPDKVESIILEQGDQNDDGATLPARKGNKELQDTAGPQERRITTKTDRNADNSSCQVMMFQSYVLQLLCVQKVLNDASAQDSTKKV